MTQRFIGDFDMMKWGALLCNERLIHGGEHIQFRTEKHDRFRSDYYRDGDRILFSSALRRMQDKTQVYPLPENDHVHSRLTHSMEVASVGRSIARDVGTQIKKRIKGTIGDDGLSLNQYKKLDDIIGDIVYAGCLAHDIGNPPFGHSGEAAIGSYFRNLFKEHPKLRRDIDQRRRTELENFEGNAQGFRRITRIQNSRTGGLQLTAATVAAFCKYPRLAGDDISSQVPDDIATKKYGCFMDDMPQLQEIAHKVGLETKIPQANINSTENKILCFSRHPLAYLVEAADNMSYLILDLEDGIRLGYVDFRLATKKLCSIARSRHGVSLTKEDVPDLRGKAINRLRYAVTAAFMQNYPAIMSGTYKKELTDDDEQIKQELEDIKDFTRNQCYEHKFVDEMALGGSAILTSLLDDFVSAVTVASRFSKSHRKMLLRLAGIPNESPMSLYQKLLMVTDYISGMTDSFASRLFRKLRGIDPSSDIR